MYYYNQSRNEPFGYSAPNGLNFVKSVNNENSLLGRVIRYLRDSEVPVTKRMIVEDVMGMTVIEGRIPCKYDYENNCWFGNDGKIGSDVLRGYHSNFFRTAVRCGFLTHKRVGKTVVWSVDSKGQSLFV